ncbi:MAG TPA: hypothetical protein VND41_03275 [Nitrososphaerales archaeon]|nr:hypothetical protein [Nitrososphaerales archaeon]
MAHRKDQPAGVIRTTAATAERIAKDILKGNKVIEILVIVNETGELLSSHESERLDEADREPDELLQKYAALTTLLLGAADVKDERLGGLELMVIVFKKTKVVLMRLPEYNVKLGMRVDRSASGEHLYRKIVDAFVANEG